MNARSYCGVDNKGRAKKTNEKKVLTQAPSIHGSRKYKRKTKMEKEKEDRVEQQEAFISFLNKMPKSSEEKEEEEE